MTNLKRFNPSKYAFLTLLLFTPFLAMAAGFRFSPAIGSYTPGQVITTSLYLNPAAGETITATKVSLNFPKDKLSVLSYVPVSGGNILAHVGTKTDNNTGSIVDNVAFNPGVSASTKIATITFKAKAAGVATVSTSSDTKALDSSNTDKMSGVSSATYTLTAPTPAPSPATNPAPSVTNNPKTKKAAKTSKAKYKKPATTKLKPEPKPDNDSNASSSKTAETEATSTEDLTNNNPEDVSIQDQTAAVAESGLGSWVWWILVLIAIILAGIFYFFFVKRRKKEDEE